MSAQLEFGLGTESRDNWPGVRESDERPIDRLKPEPGKLETNRSLHGRVLNHLLQRIEFSERHMSQFYARWEILEGKIQAHIDLPEWEKQLKNMNDAHEPPQAVRIVIPYTFAIISTIVSVLMQTFTGRKPHFQVGTYKEETVMSARNQELLLQYNADHSRMIKHFWKFFQDVNAYGVGIMVSRWKVDRARRPIENRVTGMDPLGQRAIETSVVELQEKLVYEGNDVFALDPFRFFPDPRVPMSEVQDEGEFVFWRSFEGRHKLLKEQAQGDLKWVQDASRKLPKNHSRGSDRAFITGGTSRPAEDNDDLVTGQGFMQRDEGTVEIIPRELGLGESDVPEKWIFTILNKDQIVRAEPYVNAHGQHPVSVSEPYAIGYGFGQMGIADVAAPFQDSLSWFHNSHLDNVRRVLNDVLIVDPSMVNVADLKKRGPGNVIRLKRAAFGQDVRRAINQLQIQDVTRAHIDDMQTLFFIGELVTGTGQNIMGVQDQGGRKSATEVRTAAEAGIQRHATTARIVSAQAIANLTMQMGINLQQFLSDEFMVRLLGKDGQEHPITRQDIAGDFHYPVHDGTMPLDRVAMLDAWQQILQAMLADPELRQRYDVGKTFEHVAELGGVRNIESFRVQVSPQPDALVSDGVQSGNLQPVGSFADAGRVLGGSRPSTRLQGELG